MYLWRKTYPRVLYQPVVCIHGIFYVVKDEIVFKHRYAEWVLPSSMQKHIPYNPRHVPVVVPQRVSAIIDGVEVECKTSDNSASCGVSASSWLRQSFMDYVAT